MNEVIQVREISHARAVMNPIGVIEPMHLGQMFLDISSEVFYQARGLTAADWQMVTPAEFIGSFVKIYDFFLGTPEDDGLLDAERKERFNDSEAVRATMAIDGVRVLQAFAWQAADGTDAMMVRLKFERIRDLSLFVGFDPFAAPHTMPAGVGFDIDDDVLGVLGHSRQIKIGETIMLRVEVSSGSGRFFVNDELLISSNVGTIDPFPVIALFDRHPNSRKTAPGYDRALKRLMDK